MIYPHKIFQWFSELVFPSRCIICGKHLENEYLCRKCFNILPINKQSECIGCKRATPDGWTCVFCKKEYAIDKLLIVSNFNDPAVATLIRHLKYRLIRDLARPLGELAQKYLLHRSRKGFSFVEGNPLLVPVPLHLRRENWRGFNQAELLSQGLARHYHLETAAALQRTGSATPQADIDDREQRLKNVSGLYGCVDPNIIRGRNVILVDDVCTTGATLNECARVLKDSGARFVSALVLARG